MLTLPDNYQTLLSSVLKLVMMMMMMMVVVMMIGKDLMINETRSLLFVLT